LAKRGASAPLAQLLVAHLIAGRILKAKLSWSRKKSNSNDTKNFNLRFYLTNFICT